MMREFLEGRYPASSSDVVCRKAHILAAGLAAHPQSLKGTGESSNHQIGRQKVSFNQATRDYYRSRFDDIYKDLTAIVAKARY